MALISLNVRPDGSIISQVYKTQIDTLHIECIVKPLDDTLIITKSLAPDYKIIVEVLYEKALNTETGTMDRLPHCVAMSRIYKNRDTERANIYYGYDFHGGELPIMFIAGSKASVRLFTDIYKLFKVKVGSKLFVDPDDLWSEWILIGDES